MRCILCEKELSQGVRRSARYCSSNCRSTAYRDRKRRQRHGAQDTARGLGQTSKGTARAGASRRLRSFFSPGRLFDFADLERLWKAAADQIVAALTGRPQPERIHLARPARVRMDAQVLAQAPPGAMGYRLVLPPARAADRPRFSPPRRTARPSFYTYRRSRRPRICACETDDSIGLSS
jgi:hypothetical protein